MKYIGVPKITSLMGDVNINSTIIGCKDSLVKHKARNLNGDIKYTYYELGKRVTVELNITGKVIDD